MPTNKELWKTDPSYRKKVIRELEKEGKISKIPEDEFGRLVYGK